MIARLAARPTASLAGSRLSHPPRQLFLDAVLTSRIRAYSTTRVLRNEEDFPKSSQLSTVARGTAFETKSRALLDTIFGMTLERVGGANDGGVDLIGWWYLPQVGQPKKTKAARSPARMIVARNIKKPERSANFDSLVDFARDIGDAQKATLLELQSFTTGTRTGQVWRSEWMLSSEPRLPASPGEGASAAGTPAEPSFNPLQVPPRHEGASKPLSRGPGSKSIIAPPLSPTHWEEQRDIIARNHKYPSLSGKFDSVSAFALSLNDTKPATLTDIAECAYGWRAGTLFRGEWYLSASKPKRAAGADPVLGDPEAVDEGIGRLRVIAQCKAESKKLGPVILRELEGTLHRARLDATSAMARASQPGEELAELDAPLVGVLLAQSGFSKSTLIQALASPLPLILVHAHIVPTGSDAKDEAAPLTAAGIFANKALTGPKGLLLDRMTIASKYNKRKDETIPVVLWDGTKLKPVRSE